LNFIREFSSNTDLSKYSIRELNKLAKSLIKSKIWPMENEIFRKEAILLKKREEIKWGKQCTNIFNDTQELIKTLTSEEEDSSKLFLNKTLIDMSMKLENLVWKIIVIELVSLSSGGTTPGIDGASFQKIAAKTDTKIRATRILSEEIANLKEIISVAKGKTNQAIQRKGIKGLSERERLRRWYKKEGRKEIIEKRKKLKSFLNNPIKEVNNKRESSIEHNRNLKLTLLNSLKYNKLKNFEADPIKRVYIPKGNSKDLRPLGIPTLKDRCVQMLLKLLLEPILEPLGDKYSFGYRRGRSPHLAISCLTNNLVFKRRGGDNRKRQDTFKKTIERFNRRINPKRVPEFFSTKYIIDCDIKGFFDNISHDWLIKNVPMPKNYEHLLKILLKTPIIYEDKIINENTRCGLIQGGIISPLLANWTLDGLENIMKNCIKSKTNHPWNSYFFPLGKEEFLEKKGLLKNLSTRAEKEKRGSRNTISIVRFADDIIIVTNNQELTSIIMSNLNSFLKDRGLSLSETKTRIIPWKMGNSLNYLGWTFMLIRPNRVMWMIKTKRALAGKLNDWTGMYCFPSRKSTKNLRNNVKSITSMKNTYKSVSIISQELSLLIRGWSNYFSPGGKQTLLRANLDMYIDKRCRMFLFRKYGSGKIAWAVNHFCRFNGKYIGLHVKNQNGLPSTFKVPFLYKIGVDAPWSLIKPDAELIKTSAIINPLPYIKRKILLDYLGKKDHGLLFKNQKGICPICLKNLQMYMENDENLLLDEDQSYLGPSHRKDWLLKNMNNEWNYLQNSYIGLVIDHMIPISISMNISILYKILDNISNKQLIHSYCHKIKTKEDKIKIKKFKQIIREYSNENSLKSIDNFKKAIVNENVEKMFEEYASYKLLIKNIECIK
jgi:retron-type reverse transcriptase